MSLADNIEFLRNLTNLTNFNGLHSFNADPQYRSVASRLVKSAGFGDNPGDLRMFSFVPGDQRARQKLPLVVVLHGCGQTATGYDIGAGWSTMAHNFGFALLMPEQNPSNNPNTCFNWFSPEDITRGSGEAASIRQMIEQMIRDHNIDETRIFVTGLSAGGAMTAVMLATYPDVFAGGAVIAGLPFGVATNLQQALSGMHRPAKRPAAELGDLVRTASLHRGPWPKLSVWHGSADKTVGPANADELVKQWLNVHRLSATPSTRSSVDGYPHQTWRNTEGETVVESYTITNMAHGAPLGLASDAQHYGAEGAFLIEAGISSTYHIAAFFGLTNRHENIQPSASQTSKQAPASLPTLSPRPVQPPETVTVLEPLPKARRKAETREQTGSHGVDINGIITRALTAAGLMK